MRTRQIQILELELDLGERNRCSTTKKRYTGWQHVLNMYFKHAKNIGVLLFAQHFLVKPSQLGCD
jgi:hypothetical protein